MLPNAKVFEMVGRYGGATGIVILILCCVIFGLSKMKGSAQHKDRRFQILACILLIFGVLSLASLRLPAVQRASATTTVIQTTTNCTSGKLSPVIPNNSGSVTISGDTSGKEGNK